MGDSNWEGKQADGRALGRRQTEALQAYNREGHLHTPHSAVAAAQGQQGPGCRACQEKPVQAAPSEEPGRRQAPSKAISTRQPLGKTVTLHCRVNWGARYCSHSLWQGYPPRPFLCIMHIPCPLPSPHSTEITGVQQRTVPSRGGPAPAM